MIQTEELKKILAEAKTEEDFDTKMIEHFTPSILKLLKEDVKKLIQNNHLEMFEQRFKAFKNNLYSLCNLGLLSIIDNELSFFLQNKGRVNRKGILTPIVESIKKQSGGPVYIEEFILFMVDKNINNLFRDSSFDEAIDLKNNKAIYRHLSIHGVYYCNKKEASLMLMNTLIYLLLVKNHFKEYENKVVKKGKNEFELISDDN